MRRLPASTLKRLQSVIIVLNALPDGHHVLGYDGRGRITLDNDHYQSSSTNVFDSGNVYTWDLANNLQGGSSGWTHNTSNQATAAPPVSGAPSLSGGTGLGYDASGNLAAMNGSTLSWDCGGRLSGISNTSSGSVSYSYDSAGRRVSKTVGGVTTFFLYVGDALIAELDSSGNITRSYNWGPLGLISDSSSTGSRYYLYDGVGNTRFLLNAAGQELSEGAYTAWGGCNDASYPSTPFGWKGQWGAYRDSETNLVQMGARYFAPALGRFLSRDPSGFSAGPNLYGFCAGDPIDFFDPDGCRPRCIPWENEGAGWGAVRWMSDFCGDNDDPGTFISHGHAFPRPSMGGSIYGSLIAAHDAAYTSGTMEGDTKASPREVIAARINFARAFAATGLQSYCVASCAIPSSATSTGGAVALYGKTKPGMDLTDVMSGSGLTPTQKEVYSDNINDYAEAMKNGNWDWNKTAADPSSFMIKDSQGNIMAGHHRFIGAEQAGVDIPEGVVKIFPGVTSRVPRPWSSVNVKSGYRR